VSDLVERSILAKGKAYCKHKAAKEQEAGELERLVFAASGSECQTVSGLEPGIS